MFVGKLRLSKSSIPRDQGSTRYRWRELLAILSIFAGIMFCYSAAKALRYKAAANDSLISNSSRNSSEEFLRVQQTVGSSIEQRTTSGYCQTRNCKAISCSSVLGNSDPGTVASDFIANYFKIECKDAKSVTLSFDNCEFPANTLRRNWLRTDVPIEELTFKNCFLDEVEDNLFSSPIYVTTKRIAIINNRLVSLRRTMFSHLATLEALTIQENTIKSAEFNLLEHVADSLTILELYRALDDPQVLRNITGGDRLLSKLQILSIRGNSLPVIDADLFAGATAVQSLYLDHSNIEIVSPDALRPMAASILQLILNNNNIPWLSADLLGQILDSTERFSMSLENNPWHCDCSLKWTQDLIRSHPSVLSSPPTCSTPEINAGKTFATATFCDQSFTEVTATTSPAKGSTDHDRDRGTTIDPTGSTREIASVHCSFVYNYLPKENSRKLLSIHSLRYQPRLPDFYVSENLHRGILVSLPDLSTATLVWFDNDDIEGSLSCARNVKHSYLLQNIDPQTAYTICLLNDTEPTVSPLNCLAVTSRPPYEFRTWLTNADKSLVLSLSGFSFLLLFLFGGFLSFLLIRRHPSLLRGSERVLLVKRRNVQAIVLPKGVSVNEEQRAPVAFATRVQDRDYVTPLPPARTPSPRRSRVSRLTSQGDRHSYVSGIEPAETTLESGGFRGAMHETDEYDAPPIPPYPFRENVPSLSSVVDSRDEQYYHTIVV